MYKLNTLQYPEVVVQQLDENISIQTLQTTMQFEKKVRNFKQKYNFNSLNTFSFTQDGFLALMLNLEGKIVVSRGESHPIIQAAIKYKELGFDIEFLSINKDGTIDTEPLKNMDIEYLFISSYVMDTYVKTSLEDISNLTDAVIISNVTASPLQIEYIGIALFDAYKLTGFHTHSIALHNNKLESQYIAQIDTIAINQIYKALENQNFQTSSKEKFLTALKNELGDDMVLFVQSEKTLEYTLHFGLKDITARQMIRTLALNKIYMTNGEGCSMGLSRPSVILQEMGYSEQESREALSLSFTQPLQDDQIEFIVKTIAKRYRQVRVFND